MGFQIMEQVTSIRLCNKKTKSKHPIDLEHKEKRVCIHVLSRACRAFIRDAVATGATPFPTHQRVIPENLREQLQFS